jgi:hypothetical protein
LDSCDGRFDGLDLLSLQEVKPVLSEAEAQQKDQENILPTLSNDDRPELEEWEISLYDVEFNKRSKLVLVRQYFSLAISVKMTLMVFSPSPSCTLQLAGVAEVRHIKQDIVIKMLQ